MFVFAWAAIRMITRQQVSDEGIVRSIDAPDWSALPRWARFRLMIFDWPLFLAVREREARRLYSEDLIRLAYLEQGFRLIPAEAEHTAPFFLRAIAQAAAIYGIEASNVASGLFGPKFAEPYVELDWSNACSEIRDQMRSDLADGTPLSLKRLRDAILAGFLSTVPADQKHWYYR